jgi:hypothetical protein
MRMFRAAGRDPRLVRHGADAQPPKFQLPHRGAAAGPCSDNRRSGARTGGRPH